MTLNERIVGVLTEISEEISFGESADSETDAVTSTVTLITINLMHEFNRSPADLADIMSVVIGTVALALAEPDEHMP